MSAPVTKAADLASWVRSRRARVQIRSRKESFEVIARVKEQSFRFYGEDLPALLGKMVDDVNTAIGWKVES